MKHRMVERAELQPHAPGTAPSADDEQIRPLSRAEQGTAGGALHREPRHVHAVVPGRVT